MNEEYTLEKVNIALLKLSYLDCCQTDACLDAWGHGAPACYPYSIVKIEESRGLIARYLCYRCGATWNCHWDAKYIYLNLLEYLSDKRLREYAESPPDEDDKAVACESFLERYFWAGAQIFLGNLIPQFPIGNFRVDWALPYLRLAIELDGKMSHASSEQIVRDNERDKAIRREGWAVMRFSGKELVANLPNCILEIMRVIGSRYR